MITFRVNVVMTAKADNNDLDIPQQCQYQSYIETISFELRRVWNEVVLAYLWE
jgi:hypothetical protein